MERRTQSDSKKFKMATVCLFKNLFEYWNNILDKQSDEEHFCENQVPISLFISEISQFKTLNIKNSKWPPN